MNNYTLQVEGMSCSHCEKAVSEAVSELKGIANPVVSLEEKKVTFQMDDGIMNLDTVKKAIFEAGYDVM